MGKFWDIAKCLNCGEKSKVRHREWIRASRPRCPGCGGPVEPSKAAYEEHVDHEDTGRKLAKKKGAGGRGNVIS